jgi:hypothetical protein
MLDNTALKDLPGKMVTPVAHSPGYRSPQEYILSRSQRVHFNEVNSKCVYDALSATLTSPTQRKRFDRAIDRAARRIPVAIRPLLRPRSSVD